MKTIIAGSRKVESIRHIERALELAQGVAGFDYPSEVVCGMARGADLLGQKWAQRANVPVKEMPADWSDTSNVARHLIRRRRDGSTYNVAAGYDRNQEMAEYAAKGQPDGEPGQLVAVRVGATKGTSDMIERATSEGLRVFVYDTPSRHYAYRNDEKSVMWTSS